GGRLAVERRQRGVPRLGRAGDGQARVRKRLESVTNGVFVAVHGSRRLRRHGRCRDGGDLVAGRRGRVARQERMGELLLRVVVARGEGSFEERGHPILGTTVFRGGDLGSARLLVVTLLHVVSAPSGDVGARGGGGSTPLCLKARALRANASTGRDLAAAGTLLSGRLDSAWREAHRRPSPPAPPVGVLGAGRHG